VEGSSSTTEEGSSDGSSTGANIPEPGDASGVRVKAFVSHVAVDPDTTEATVWFVAERPRGDISTHGGFSIRVTAEDGFRGSGLYTPLDQEVYFAPGERYASVRVALQAGRAEGLHQVVVRASNPNGGAVLHAAAYAFSYLDIEDDGIPADARHVDPGAGYGGSCFPKDTRALINTAREHGLSMSLVAAAERINEAQKVLMVRKARDLVGDVAGKTIAMWGLAFKPNTDDVREAPALRVARTLITDGAKVRGHDPEGGENFVRDLQDQTGSFELVDDPYTALEGADCLLLMTEWRQYRSPDFAKIKSLMGENPVLIDGRNQYDRASLEAMGFKYAGIGR
jgi:hypothetical protein